MTGVAPPRAHKPQLGMLPALLALLLLTATILLLWGHFRPLDQDEMFVLQTDSVRSVRALVEVQRHTPISLDPLFYHLLGHASVSVFGATAFGIRLPSLFGFLLMQVCLYLIGWRLAGARAGWIAAAMPALTATLFYGVQARPYGVLLGLASLILLSWLRATRGDDKPRAGALVLLAASVALALNTHYFAILLLVPLYGAELVRIVDGTRAEGRLRIDWPVALAIVAGTAGQMFTLPFQHAAGEFRKHYYNAGQVGWHAVTQSYRALLINYTNYPMAVQRVIGIMLLVGTLLLLVAMARLLRTAVSPANDQPTNPMSQTRDMGHPLQSVFAAEAESQRLDELAQPRVPHVSRLRRGIRTPSQSAESTSLQDVEYASGVLSAAEWAFVLLLAALPFAGFLLARFVTHSIEVRYVLPGMIGLALLIALALRPVFTRFPVVPVALLLIAVAGAERVREEAHRLAEWQAAATVAPEVRAWLQAHPQGKLYVQNTGHFEEALPFFIDPLLQNRTTLLYSAPQEIGWLGHDTGALTAMHLHTFSTVPVECFEALQQQHGSALFVQYPPSGWDWLPREFTAEGVPQQRIGQALGGTAVAVELPLTAGTRP